VKLALVGDIGGTNARFALWKDQQLEAIEVHATADYRCPEDAIKAYLRAQGLALGALGSLLLGAVMAHWTDAAQPWLDAALTAFSLVAQWWMAQKRVQCWPLWIAVDVIFVGLFVYKELYLTAALYALFTLLAVQGWRAWRADPALQS